MMIKLKLLTVIILISLSSILKAQDLDAETVNFDSLARESDAVVLFDNVEFEIYDRDYAEYRHSIAFIIKNEDALKYCSVVLTESAFTEVYDIKAVIKDTLGHVIKELDSDNIREIEFSGEHFYSGNLYKVFELTHHTFPYIFEYAYTIEMETLLLWPDWYPQSAVPSLYSSYRLVLDEPVKFKYLDWNTGVEPVVKIENSDTVYHWEMYKIPERIDEDFLPPEYRVQRKVLFTPTSFSTGGYLGSAASWKDFGGWYYQLSKDRYQLPEEAKKKVRELVSGISSNREKIEVLYRYMQNKTRYVAIEMGLAGWQPQRAADVYNNNYGDCKDLSTFMISLLEAAGINAYPALALTRRKGVVNKDFPANQFNHCIAFVPLENDTVWLECTASYIKAGEMPFGIEDINALVVKGAIGEIVRTPVKTYTQNYMTSSIKGEVDPKGNMIVSVSITAAGNPKIYLNNEMSSKSKQDCAYFLQEYISDHYAGFNIDMSSVDITNATGKDYRIEFSGQFDRFIKKAGKRIFINPSVFRRLTADNIPDEELDERIYPVYYYYPCSYSDTVTIDFPKNIRAEYLPENADTSIGIISYSSEYDFVEGRLQYVRNYNLKKNLIPVENYGPFKNFLEAIVKYDDSKCIMKRN